MIGVFDSGIGGLTVVRALKEHLAEYDILYFGDTARTPYGTKSPETVIQYAIEDAEILLDRGARLLVVGCNTASSVATEVLRRRFDEPVFEVISPAVRMAVSQPRHKRVGIIGTRATVGSKVYENKIKALCPETEVYAAACPLLVPLVEEGWLKRPETRRIVKKYLHPLKLKQIDVLILGCTHYPLLKGIIQEKIGKRVKVIDSSEALACSVKEFLHDNPDIATSLKKESRCRFFVSDVTPHLQKLASSILKSTIRLEYVRL
ncbi:MAG: glutamate racemase [Deltaproteobacteria bacterium]|nr:glutamate racemase [Deltaproteobacteria bacterium]RLB88150.1 MAG: glutamate racemase [Deltaproteobacteria bacterium]RLB90287.1 MAG: glutamate racemase [Deltaproteobacteria bacterium]RLC07781.1 MAG: glutamate racemase [Deltaproteobacteria bacterium]